MTHSDKIVLPHAGGKVKPDLDEYRRKRNFKKTPEPAGSEHTKLDKLRFVVQKHAATQLHYDLRLEFDGDFKSWAVPKGPSLNPMDQRLAVRVENHPIEYGSFEGIIPSGNYGAGTVMIWDAGWLYSRKTKEFLAGQNELSKGYARGHITFLLDGQKLKGEFALIRLKDGNGKTWLLVKKGDKHASYKSDVLAQDKSVATGRTMEEIKAQAKAKGEVWIPGVGPSDKSTLQSPYIESKVELIKSNEEAPMPRRLKPMIPQVSKKLFDHPEWFYEALPEGSRAILELEGSKVKLYSRSGLSLNNKFAPLVLGLKEFSTKAILDGVIVSKGKSHAFVVLDVVYLIDSDLRSLPLEQRLERLGQLGQYKWLLQNERFLSNRNKLKGETLLVRHRLSTYRSGVHNEWQQCPNTTNASAQAPTLKIKAPVEKKIVAPTQVFTNLKKVYWPETKNTKEDVIRYYSEVAEFILPHLKDRPMSLHRHPNGVAQQSFFQKDVIGYVPSFVTTTLIQHSDKSVNYIVCQNKETLLYLANLGCIELNPWLSRISTLEIPDWIVIDLDPLDVDFQVVVETALLIHEKLDSMKVTSFCKTSGSKGLHIIIPNTKKLDYDLARAFAQKICQEINEKNPRWTSVERSPSRRQKRVYLDFLQNVWGQTLAAPYCIRPKSRPLVSTPLEWSEVNSELKLELFHIGNIKERLEKKGDLWSELLKLY